MWTIILTTGALLALSLYPTTAGWVVCYQGYKGQGHLCGEPMPIYAANATECCSRRGVKAFAYLGSDHRPIACLPCPIDGGWTEWSPWSPCSGNCGRGLRTRARECNRPFPQHGGKVCPEPNTESQICSTAPCPEWGPWSQFATCSATCGAGLTVRRRLCQGTGCLGSDVETAPCKGPPCQTFQQGYAQNAEWGPWGDCDANCGPGLRTRKRMCPFDDIGAGCGSAESAQTETCTGKDCSDIHIGQIVAWTVAAVAFLALLVVLTVICKRKRIARKYYYQLLPVRFRSRKEKKGTNEPLPAIGAELPQPARGGKTRDSWTQLSVEPVSEKLEQREGHRTDSQGYEIPSSPRYMNLRASWSSLSPDQTHIYEELHSGLPVTMVPGKRDQSAQTEH